MLFSTKPNEDYQFYLDKLKQAYDKAEYPWSSYHYNALGEGNPLVAPHLMYKQLRRSKIKQQEAYRGLFDTVLDKQSLDDIREATNKAWVLGSDLISFDLLAFCREPNG